MKNVIFFCILTIIVLSITAPVFACGRHDCHHSFEKRMLEEAGKTAVREVTKNVFNAFFGGPRHSNYGHSGNYRYSEYDQARQQGYEEARRRHLEELYWQQEENRRQRLEAARLQGEIMYNNGYRRY